MSTDHERPGPHLDHEPVEALARSAVGDVAAREELLRAIRPLVCRWALTRTGDEDVAEDVAQEVLIRVHRTIGVFDARSRFTTWLYRIVANVATDAGRRRKRDAERSERISRRTPPDPVTRPNPAASPDAHHVRLLLAALLNHLSPRQRSAFELVDLQGFSGREAAQMEEIEEATLRVHLSRARAVIRSAIRAQAI